MSDPIKQLSGAWLIIPDFNLESRSTGTCSVTNLPKRPGDVGVFRPYFDTAYIDEEGYYDITQVAIEEAASMLGWVPPSVAADLRAEIKQRQLRIMQDGRKIAQLQHKIERLTRDEA